MSCVMAENTMMWSVHYRAIQTVYDSRNSLLLASSFNVPLYAISHGDHVPILQFSTLRVPLLPLPPCYNVWNVYQAEPYKVVIDGQRVR
jgi:hypothetical protein